MSVQNWHKWTVLLVGLALSARPIGCDYSSITEKFGAEDVARCNEKCPFQNRTGDGHFDVNCGSDCSVQQCMLGCSLWKEGLEKSCQTVCNVTSETVFSRELYCVMGCNEALNTYYQKLKELIGTPPAPALVADSLSPTSLSLVWEAPNHNLSYLLQWRYEELPGSWQYYSNTSHDDRSIIHVENLRPYTKYRFRVAIFLSDRGGPGEPVTSASSVVISTMESGKPSSPPSSLRAVAPDPTRVLISWEPGPFPNGPLISYVLRLADTQPNTNYALEDMPASNNTLFYMFQNLAPARDYEVSVALRNLIGVGPRAFVKISTPPLPTPVPSQQPILILGGENYILAAPANDMLSDPVELYSTQHSITGVGLDVSSDSLFVSVSSGYVYRSSLSHKSQPKPILAPRQISYKPLDLSVDWLNKHLYVLGEVYYNRDGSTENATVSNWEILRCDFDGRNQIVALSGFNLRPVHFEVDAYNGYLFWSIRSQEHGGLYRLDLANISNGVHHDAPPELIVRDVHLGAFTVDHADFRILVAHHKNNTILAVSLDGRKVTDLRSNTQKPTFRQARSIAYASGLFYWTNGEEMLTEEYHKQTDSYFVIEYPSLMYHTKIFETRQVLVALRSCQPIPVPVNPPIAVQGVMGINKSKVSWSPPHLLGHQGNGAWQRWTFHLQLTNTDSGKTVDIKNISESMYLVENLKQDSEYIIRVAAVTESGSGPWSSEFIGRTLIASPNTLSSTLLWSGPDGLLQTDLTGDNLQTLIHRSHLKNLDITDISWYRDKLYLVTNTSSVMWYNTTTHEKGVMSNMENVGSLAVDWVGKKIYWSNPKQQLITRGNFDGTNREPVPIVTVAKELTIDSLAAYIYWNTGHAVEAARLNGENKMVYYPAQLFSGKQVMGLTADLEKKWLYWLVRSYDGSELHRAPTAEQLTHGVNEISGTLITRLSGTATLGPLCYFSGRLVWVQDAKRAVVSDLAGRYTAELMPRVHVIAVRDPTLHGDSESLSAIPENINASSIQVVGVWNNFNITWAPVTNVNVNNSRVYYDVSLLLPGQQKIERTIHTPHTGPLQRIPPHTPLQVVIRGHSAWGRGGVARAALRSPQAPPATPAHSALYTVRVDSGGSLTAIFRWQPPSKTNGIIRGYEVKCWVITTRGSNEEKPSACADARLPPSHTQLMLRDLVPASKYYFQVRAYTDAGFGPYSDVVSGSSDEINPIPKVMVSSQESIKIVDLDSGDSETIPKSTGIPADFAVSLEENVVYWANNLDEIFSSRINGSGHYKLTSINGSASSICVDWVSRSVYWTQLEMSSSDSYVMYRADLSSTRPQIRRILGRRQPIYNLQVAPLQRSLHWYEESVHPGLGTIMSSKTDGTAIRSFFNISEEAAEFLNNCNCPQNPQVAKTFVIDMTKKNYELYWVDPWVHQILSSDMNGCKCRVVIDATEKKKYGFTPMSITVDSKYVYWFNSSEKAIFYTTKNKRSKIEHFKAAFGYKILALDPGNQPYPPRQCLFPKTHILRPRVLSHSANSLTLQMPEVEKPCNDMEYEMTATEFTVFYKQQLFNDSTVCVKETCPYITTTSKEVVLNELKSFTNYTLLLEYTNYYAKLHEMKPIVGSSLVLQTAAEAPTAPKHITGIVLNPVQARVEWTPDPKLWYELHWRTDNSTSILHKFKEHNMFEVPEGHTANLTLSPGTTYTVWVRARSRYSKETADSEHVILTTPPSPPPLTAVNVTAYSIIIQHLPVTYQVKHYKVEFTEASSSSWRLCSNTKEGWVANELRPHTHYRFRLRLQYVTHAPLYFWPNDDRFSYLTLGDVPEAPSPLRVESLGDKIVRAWWTEPDSRGASIQYYQVWGRPQYRSHDEDHNSSRSIEDFSTDLPADMSEDMKLAIMQEGLELLHNGTDSYWLITAGSVAPGYVGMVQACNRFGCSAPSPPAALEAPPARALRPHSVALAAALAAFIVLLFVVTAGVFCTYNRRSKKKSAIENQVPLNMNRRGPDVELATLRQLPIRHSTNILYNQGVHCPTDAELASLPHIRREQITLTKFLGSGAFGEVFEGHARNINNTTADTKVAVKTLRKGATDQEKTEFLKEAALMSNFKHEHILRLLGVCLDNDPNYIIMELMEGGDLLSYLRAKRTFRHTPESLTLLDLLNMCVDVTKGCRYLEEMHFVHRDLACRNCLVASRANGRIVKIGDFGLARDIYKNDYYRKEGEGLLPVRWMAVECLVDGVFSCQSDVWAWGVLCWEVLSLGQQPYPARTNREVLAYVRAGGKPDRPPNCPSVFYELLQKCWSYSAEARPSFRHCLDVVTALRDKTSPNITLTESSMPAADYLTVLGDACSDAVDNRTYLLDENDNACLDEDYPHQMEPSHLLPERRPKYLDLMHEHPSTFCDGYEIPRPPITYAPFSRHSIVGVAPNRLIKPPLYRTHSLKTSRPPNATIIPLRNGIVKRASLCEGVSGFNFSRELPTTSETHSDHDLDKHVFKTPF